MSLKKHIKQKYIEREVNKERNHETILTMALAGDKRTKLTPDEKDLVKNLWGGVELPDATEWEVYKYLHGFDERFLGHNVYLPLVARRLNDYRYTKFFENKCLVDCFKSNALFPEVVLRCVDGEYYDGHMHQLDKTGVEGTINELTDSIIIKPSIENGNGRGVVKIDPKADRSWSQDLRKTRGNNFVIQKCVKQHESLARFNESSVNTFRITTLYLNGEYTVCNIMFRFGRKGSIVDNANHGGNFVSVHENGQLYDYGLDNGLNRAYECNGIKLKEVSFDFMPELLNKVKDWHMNSYSLCKFVGWDIAIDQSKQYVLLEINSSQPGIFFEQLAVGEPIFRERTAEVIDYVTHKEFRYDRSIISY